MKKTAAALAALMVSACATDPNIEAKRAEIQATIPTCTQAKECEVKWAAARDWVLANSGMKIQNITDGYIETYAVVDYSPVLAAQVVKKVLANGSYRIEAKIWCGNPLGCSVSPTDALLDFNRTVTAAYRSQ
jgi:hypothetical protein